MHKALECRAAEASANHDSYATAGSKAARPFLCIGFCGKVKALLPLAGVVVCA
jgi:hypothetical protein